MRLTYPNINTPTLFFIVKGIRVTHGTQGGLVRDHHGTTVVTISTNEVGSRELSSSKHSYAVFGPASFALQPTPLVYSDHESMLDENEQSGKKPRVNLLPSMYLKDGHDHDYATSFTKVPH